MIDRVYYAARQWRDFPTALAALESVGIPTERAKLIIANSRVNASDVIVADLGDGKGLAVTTAENGGVIAWQAMIGVAKADRAEVEADGRRLAELLNDESIVAVFSWDRPQSTAPQ